MPAPFIHRDAAEIMGSWPFSFTPQLTNPQLVQNSLEAQATLRAFRREPSAGYVVGSLAFFIEIDTVQTQVNFSASNKTLAEVITQINTDVASTVAFNDNGFLRLTSTTVGGASQVKVDSIAASEDVFVELGLVDGYEALAGDIQHAQNIDPSRQIAFTGQLAMPVGEPFSASALNRLALQQGINTDFLRGFTDLKRIAVRAEESFVGSGLGGVQLGTPSDKVYLGTIGAPTVDDLKDIVVVLDDRGNEFTKEMEDAGSTQTDLAFTFDADTGEQLVNSAAITFLAADPDENWYVITTNLTVETQLNDVPMKVIRFIDASNVVIDPVDPATGVRAQISESARSGRRSQIFNVRCSVDGFYEDGSFSLPITPQTKIPLGQASDTVTEIRRNNRVVVDQVGVDFTANVSEGDFVVWAGSGTSSPWSNDGNYRVRAVISPKEIELMGEDYGPVFLNPDVGSGFGTVTVQTDGDFVAVPFVRFAPATLANFNLGTGAIPDGENFSVVYYRADSLRSSLETDPTSFSDDIRQQLSDVSQTQNAIMRLVGPSVTEFDEVLYGEEMLNMDFLGREHHRSGRHSTVRPDVIDMYPGQVDVPTVTIRGSVALDGVTTAKFRLLDDFSDTVHFAFNYRGELGIGDDITTFPQWDALDIAGSPLRGDIWVERSGVRATGLLKGDGAHWALQGENVSSPAVNTSVGGINSVRYHFDDAIIAQPQVYNTAQQASGTAGEGFLTLGNVINDGAGNSFINNLIVHANGNVGIHFGTDIEVTEVPQVPLHVRMRPSSSQLEALRLEGDSALTDATIAMSWKPITTLPFFAFVEVDHDNPGGAGDWFFNFVTTADMDSDSDGTLGLGIFRWVTAGAFGSGTELARLSSDVTGVFDVGRNLQGSAADANQPRFATEMDSVHIHYLSRFRAGTAGVKRGYSTLADNGGDYEELWGCGRNVAGTYFFDKNGADTHFGRRTVNTSPGGLQYNWQWREDGSVSDPFAGSSFINLFSIFASVSSGPVIVSLSRGYMEHLVPSTIGNPSSATATVLNAYYAKNNIKAWAILDGNAAGSGGAYTVVDGFNISSATLVGTGPLRCTLVTDLTDDDDTCFLITNGSSPAGSYTKNNTLSGSLVAGGGGFDISAFDPAGTAGGTMRDMGAGRFRFYVAILDTKS